MSTIPVMVDPLGRYWEQPDRSEIEIDDTYALMSKAAFDKLADYSMSIPSGTYIGKMWKCHYKQNEWFLVWYGEDKEPGFVTINKRRILVV